MRGRNLRRTRAGHSHEPIRLAARTDRVLRARTTQPVLNAKKERPGFLRAVRIISGSLTSGCRPCTGRTACALFREVRDPDRTECADDAGEDAVPRDRPA